MSSSGKHDPPPPPVPDPSPDPEVATYEMKNKTRGVCLIINNKNFEGHEPRFGTDEDQKDLSKVFKWLGFKIQIEKDCTEQRMREVLEQLGKEDHGDRDCLVCCLMSHGQKEVVCGVDGKELSLKDIMEPFLGANCSSLVGKPKLFFIQACQGSEVMSPVPVSPSSAIAADTIKPEVSIPNEADILLGMASVPNFVSLRNLSEGSWYMQSLCDNLVKLVPRGQDLLSILTVVNADVATKSDPEGKIKQMPQPAYSLRKKVVFPVPKEPAPQLELNTTA